MEYTKKKYNVNEICNYKTTINKARSIIFFKEDDENLIIFTNNNLIQYITYNSANNSFREINELVLENNIELIEKINKELFIVKFENWNFNFWDFNNNNFTISQISLNNSNNDILNKYNDLKITNMKFCQKYNNLIFSFFERNFFILRLNFDSDDVKITKDFFYTPHELYVSKYRIINDCLYSLHFKKILILNKWNEEKETYEIYKGIKFDEQVSYFELNKDLIFIGFNNLYIAIVDNEIFEIIISYKVMNEKINNKNKIVNLNFINILNKEFDYDYFYDKNKFLEYLSESYFIIIDKYNKIYKIKNKKNSILKKIKVDNRSKMVHIFGINKESFLFIDLHHTKRDYTNNLFFKVFKYDINQINNLSFEYDN